MKRWHAAPLVVALVLAVWLAWTAWRQDPAALRDAIEPARGASTAPPVALQPAEADHAPMPGAVPQAASAGEVRSPSPGAGQTVELCGLGQVSAGTLMAESAGGAPALPRHIGEYAADAAREQMLRALAGGPPRWRAAAALMQGREATAVQALGREAQAAGDPLILRWAIARCGENRGCAQPLAARWVEVEPGNAVAWLMLLDAAPQQRERALAGLRRASAFRSGWAQLAAVQHEAMPGAVLPYVQAQLAIEAIGIEAALPDPTMFVLSGLCRPPWGDAKTLARADCDALARLMVERSDTLLALSVGSSIGKRLDWPAERLEALRRQAESETQAMGLLVRENPFSCSATQAMHEWVRDVARDGERAALRARMPASAPR